MFKQAGETDIGKSTRFNNAAKTRMPDFVSSPVVVVEGIFVFVINPRIGGALLIEDFHRCQRPINQG